ncbi:collagen alpha-4(VI) chain [Actinoplanes awajinensis subsp. mycoplanecinus]|uniref:Collagen alpha-4(VI) chain n=1 Tax=Actinoplanes awajinensis subsp. mycoplanecinus TaxID=135947 RepID=A0A0X3VFN1_9ACTN|nr:collagen alpha-4(VI) chain [Actinoplanes awajinensis subsp. mycoplanecinus]
MGSSGNRRTGLAAAGSGRTRLLAAGAVVVAVGGVIGFTQLSHADETPSTKAASESGAGKIVNGQKILTDTCIDSNLTAHDGFQKGDRCVSTEFGEVASAANDASLLITEAPARVAPNTPFTLKVSTRNLIRDRFLAAGQGGYYVESSVLQNGIVRGHFHTACRLLASTKEAPDPAPVPAFFVATEDKKGDRAPDTVTIQVPGLPAEGTAQCASWAGDGSHRTPMMERANQTPAIDAVRITVSAAGGGNNGGNQNNGGNNQGGNNQGGNTGGGNQNNGGNNQGGNTGGNNTGGNNQGGNNQNNGGNTGNNTNTGSGNATATPKATVKTTVSPNATKTTTAGSTGGSTTDDETTTGTTKTTISPNPKPTTKPAQTTTKSTTSDNDSDSAEETESTTEETTTKAPTKKPKPQVTESEEAAGSADYGVDGGEPDQAEPTSTSDAVLAEPAAGNDAKGGPLTLLGDHPAWFGGGAVLVLLAVIAFAFARSRPRRY